MDGEVRQLYTFVFFTRHFLSLSPETTNIAEVSGELTPVISRKM
jgi:hypothetical protein